MTLIGCIADDFTGATDLASALVKAGLRVHQYFEVPTGFPDPTSADAVVIALKTRSCAVEEAVRQSLAAWDWLQQLGASRCLFKYCSTFDSTPDGNIGPVAESLLDAVGGKQCIFCPAFPENGRTQYLGHLFVNGQLLSQSGMRHHPLTPMDDSQLVSVLEKQSSRAVGLVAYPDIAGGPSKIRERLRELGSQHRALVLTDALADEHLRAIASAATEMPLVTGGSAIGGAMVEAWRTSGLLSQSHSLPLPPAADGPTVVFSGSCSQATQQQVLNYKRHHPALQLSLLEEPPSVSEITDWCQRHRDEAPLVYTTVSADELARIQERLGRAEAALAAERLLADVAERLVSDGFRRLIVAGGETSGAIVQRLGIQGVRIGPEICPGVPWTETLGQPTIAMALKSGNFGSPNFFDDAQRPL